VSFLYLPDAVSLTLLIIALNLLRRSAIAHCQQELHRLRLDLLLCWTDKELPTAHQAYGNLRSQISSASGLLAGVSPARLFFVRDRWQKTAASADQQLLLDWSKGLEPSLQALDDRKARAKLRRIQLEFDISFGMFFLLGSISGWMVTGAILFKLIRRMLSQRPANRTDWAFDLMERIFSRLGRRALRLAFVSQPSAQYLT
jgi:hypothetical protein